MEKVLTTYKAPVNSYPLSQQRSGIMASGRYTGFDILDISDSAPGFIGMLRSGDKTTLPSIDEDNSRGFAEGTLLTPHGLVIKSSDNHALSITPNASIPIRYDIIYCEYSWVSEEGGGPILWGIIEGTNDGELPELNNPNTQTRLGVITVPINATALTITYTPDPVPLLGGVDILQNFPVLLETFAGLNRVNKFTKVQALGIERRGPLALSNQGIILGEDSNFFELYGDLTNFTASNLIRASNKQFLPGTRIGIHFYHIGANCVLSSTPNSDGYSFTFSLIGISGNMVLAAEDYVEFVLDSDKYWVCIAAPTYLARRSIYSMGSIALLDMAIIRDGRTANRVIKTGNLITIDAGFTTGVDASNNTPTEVAQLPIGFYPVQPVEIPIVLVPTGVSTTTRTGTLLIGTDGTLRAYHHGALSSSLGCSFNVHISFFAS